MFISVTDWLNEYYIQEPLLMQHKKLSDTANQED